MNNDWEGIIPIATDLTDDIVEEFLNNDAIDTEKFWKNYECLLRRHESALMVSYEGADNEKVSFSLCELLKVKTIGGMPLWFVAAYPDVVKWLVDNEERIEKSDILNFRQLIDKYLEDTNRELECS